MRHTQRVHGLVFFSAILLTPKQERAAGWPPSQFFMILILALNILAQYQFLTNPYTLCYIFQVFATAAVEFHSADPWYL